MLVFNIHIEFSRTKISEDIFHCLKSNSAKYVCAVDGNVLANAQKDMIYREIINASLFNLCDGSSIALFTNWIYDTNYSAFTGPMIFKDLLYKDYKQLLLGNTEDLLCLLKNRLIRDGCTIENYAFVSLPFKKAEDFDYQLIAEEINKSSYDIIWVSLGAPKQEIFVSKLTPFLNRGVVFAIGAAFNLVLDETREFGFSIFMKKCHMGWVLRVAKEPKRIGVRAWNYFKIIPGLIYAEYKKRNKEIY